MMATREELIEAERREWAAFMALAHRVTPEMRDVREVVPGWSVKDLMWHNAGWALFSAEELQRQDGAAFVDPFSAQDDASIDAENDAQLDAGRQLRWDAALAEVESMRGRAHIIWAGLGDLSPDAADFLAEETTVHYREHAAEIERFLEG
jgi:hypothetical protein